MLLNPHFDPRRHLGFADAPSPAEPGAAQTSELPRVTYVRPFAHRLRIEAGDLLQRLRAPSARFGTASCAWIRTYAPPFIRWLWAEAGDWIRSVTAWATRWILLLLSSLWLRFGFAPTTACAFTLLTFFGASMLGHHDPVQVALTVGRWAFVLALAMALVIQARKQVRRAVRW